ncbi:MAG: alkaline phosphatase family protein [Planctomycetes bacterium]|nr:alkaline phosphatase family protein [Planctomycetota bacterium]
MRNIFVVLISLSILFNSKAVFSQTEQQKPKLGILLVFDQLRGDYISRWQDHFVKDGFLRLTSEGAWFENCHYPYSGTLTGAGHATLTTGATPSVHGIVGNDWYDRKEGKNSYCAGSSRWASIPHIPEIKPAPGTAVKTRMGGTPEKLRAETLGDALKRSTNNQGKVVCLSFKDRSSVLPGGMKPDHCYWFDTASGKFQTSTFYSNKISPWLADFNDSKFIDQWRSKSWEKLYTTKDYKTFSGFDDQSGEGNGKNQGKSFPHPFGKIEKDYYDALYNSPFGNDVLLELATKAIKAENLGKNSQPDLLLLSFSCNDSVGHSWGPDSQEVFDSTLRTDLLIRNLLLFLDKEVGKNNYVIALSADHGVCPLPEVSKGKGLDAGRFATDKFAKEIETALQEKFGKPTTPAKYLEAFSDTSAYLNYATLKANDINLDDATAFIKTWASNLPGILTAYTSKEISLATTTSDPFLISVSKSWFKGRSGDICFILKPYHIPGSYLTGTTHGSPHYYDTHVPLIAFGGGVKTLKIKEKVSPQLAASIIAEGIGISLPASAEFAAPKEIWHERK